jgi:hypothetical protein
MIQISATNNYSFNRPYLDNNSLYKVEIHGLEMYIDFAAVN